MALTGAGEQLELTVVGQLLGADGVTATSAHCAWKISLPSGWKLVSGALGGESQLDTPMQKGSFVWQHPIDVCLQGDCNDGWPSLQLEVRSVDDFALSNPVGYSIEFLPSNPGSHLIQCPLWRPQGTFLERLGARLVSGTLQLKLGGIIVRPLVRVSQDDKLVLGLHDVVSAEQHDAEKQQQSARLVRSFGDRRMTTVGAGTVSLLLYACVRKAKFRTRPLQHDDEVADRPT
eukprot:6204974-Pleurochrysis_carterae.AAC.2